jgi:hypothetical protein
MSTTPKYDLDLTDYGTVGWNAILQGSIEDIDDFLHTRIAGSCGATIAEKDLVYLDSSGKYRPAQAGKGTIPCLGFALNAGNADDDLLIGRIGPYVSFAPSALIPGGHIYCSAGTPGGYTQKRPLAFAQSVGRILNATDIFIWMEDLSPIHFGATALTSAATGYPDGTVYFQYTP